jgi:hypothetical protein
VLWEDYLNGVVEPRLLEQLISLPKPAGATVGFHNHLVCLDIAAVGTARRWRGERGGRLITPGTRTMSS